MRSQTVSRKAAFRAALALAGMTRKDWLEANGVSNTHLHTVLAGTRESQTLTDRIDAFIAEYAPRATMRVA